MRKIIFVFLIVLSPLSIFAQKSKMRKTPSPAKKTATKKVSAPAAQTVEREKFDPAKNPNDDLQAAILRASKENKRIVLDVGGEWCGWCIHMDRFVAAHDELKNLRDANFIWVKVNMSEENENKPFLSKYPAIEGYPHLFVLEKDGTLLKSKDTSELEDGNTYNLQKFMDFLKEYSPTKIAVIN